jgi:hypothetical protein
VKKYLVHRNRDGRKSSWEFDTAEEVARFLAGQDPRHHQVFVQVEGLDFSHEGLMSTQLFGVSLEADLNL